MQATVYTYHKQYLDKMILLPPAKRWKFDAT